MPKGDGVCLGADLLLGKDLKAGPRHEAAQGLRQGHGQGQPPEDEAAVGAGGRAGPGGAGRGGGQSPESGREAGAGGTTW